MTSPNSFFTALTTASEHPIPEIIYVDTGLGQDAADEYRQRGNAAADIVEVDDSHTPTRLLRVRPADQGSAQVRTFDLDAMGNIVLTEHHIAHLINTTSTREELIAALSDAAGLDYDHARGVRPGQ